MNAKAYSRGRARAGGDADAVASTAPLTSADVPTSGPTWGFRLVQLNAAGWSGVLAPGAVLGGLIGAVVGRAARRPLRIALCGAAGGVVGLLVARAVDEMRWRDSSVRLLIDEPDEALDVMQAVRAAGVHADMVRAEHPDLADGGLGYEVRYRARDERRVRAVLSAQHG